MKGLTKRQTEILWYLILCVEANGFVPTYRELGHKFNITYMTAVSDHLKALWKKGYIQMYDGARAIQILKDPYGRKLEYKLIRVYE